MSVKIQPWDSRVNAVRYAEFCRDGPTSDAFTPVPPDAVTDAQGALSDRAAAAFQEASRLYEKRLYRMPDQR